MQDDGMIAGYAEALASKLRFDRSLSQRVRQEVEDHLRDAVASDPAGGLAAERRAIANFGDPRLIAAQFAAAFLAWQSKKAGVVVMMVAAGVFLSMKARVAWYAMAAWTLPEDIRAVSATIASLDAYAFWCAVLVGTLGVAYINSRRVPTHFHPVYRRQLRRFLLLCAAATAALALSVISDGVLTALRLARTEFSADVVIPFCSMALEIAGSGFLILYLRGIAAQTVHAARLLAT